MIILEKKSNLGKFAFLGNGLRTAPAYGRKYCNYLTLKCTIPLEKITSTPTALFPGFRGGAAPHLQSQGKAPWGRGWVFTSYAQTKVSINFLLTIDTHYLKDMAVVKSAHGKILLQSPFVYSYVSEWI